MSGSNTRYSSLLSYPKTVNFIGGLSIETWAVLKSFLAQFWFHCVKKVCFYIAQYPVRWTAQSALHFTPGRPVHSCNNSASPGSILAITREGLLTRISIIYSQVLISGSLHISLELSPVHSFTSFNHCLKCCFPRDIFQSTLSCEMVLARVPFALTTCPNHLSFSF